MAPWWLHPTRDEDAMNRVPTMGKRHTLVRRNTCYDCD
jgi:hypothetical protein